MTPEEFYCYLDSLEAQASDIIDSWKKYRHPGRPPRYLLEIESFCSADKRRRMSALRVHKIAETIAFWEVSR